MKYFRKNLQENAFFFLPTSMEPISKEFEVGMSENLKLLNRLDVND